MQDSDKKNHVTARERYRITFLHTISIAPLQFPWEFDLFNFIIVSDFSGLFPGFQGNPSLIVHLTLPRDTDRC
ncbi:MAG: hypothetical protein ABII68_03785 [Pseudomonadota bacterium]